MRNYLTKTRICFFVVFILCAASVFSQSFSDIHGFLNLDMTLKGLSRMTGDQLTELSSEHVLVTGSVVSRTVLDSGPESFMGQIELVDGEWNGTESVEMYMAIVLVQGPEWADRIPARRSRELHPLEIPQNSTVIVIGRILEPFIDDNGKAIPVIEGLYIRVIQ